MKVVYSPRVEDEIVRVFRQGAARFGVGVANNTLRKVRRAFEVTLAMYPYLGYSLGARDLYRYAIPTTPFVAYYKVDSAAQTITILALFYGAQDRSEFERP
jgi:plasmid stabilization system protein ParE